MKSRHLVAALLVLQASQVLAADWGEIQISPRLGAGKIRVKGELLADKDPATVSALAAGVALGYVSPIGLMAEGGYSTQRNLNWFGTKEYHLDEYSLAVGWQIETPRGFRIIPKIGRTRWDLSSENNTFADATVVGRRVDEKTIRGYDDFWELTLQKKVSQSIALGVTYKDNGYDFGNARAIAFTATFGL